MKRFQLRIEELRTEAMAELDAYEPNEADKLAQQIAFWEGIAAKGVEQGEQAKRMLDTIRARAPQ